MRPGKSGRSGAWEVARLGASSEGAHLAEEWEKEGCGCGSLPCSGRCRRLRQCHRRSARHGGGLRHGGRSGHRRMCVHVVRAQSGGHAAADPPCIAQAPLVRATFAWDAVSMPLYRILLCLQWLHSTTRICQSVSAPAGSHAYWVEVTAVRVLELGRAGRQVHARERAR